MSKKIPKVTYFGTVSQIMNAPIPTKSNGSKPKITLGSVLNHFSTIISKLRSLQESSNQLSSSSHAVIVYYFYKLSGETNTINAFYQTLIRRVSSLLNHYHLWKKVPSLYKTAELDNVYSHLAEIKKVHLAFQHIFTHSRIADKKHMEQIIIKDVEHNKLNYRTQKQFNRMTDNNLLYKLQIHNKKGIINTASITDILNILINAYHHLKLLNNKLGHNKAL